MTCTNISKDFEKNDTCPYNACIFINDDFLSSFVTDHSEPANLASEPPYQDRPEAILTVSVCQPVIGCCNKGSVLVIVSTIPEVFSPLIVPGFVYGLYLIQN